VVSFTLRPLYPQGKSPWYPLDSRLDGPQSRSESGGEEKNSQPLPGLEPPIIQLVVQRTTELNRLHFVRVQRNYGTCAPINGQSYVRHVTGFVFYITVLIFTRKNTPKVIINSAYPSTFVTFEQTNGFLR
jgi:hypothetical protein